ASTAFTKCTRSGSRSIALNRRRRTGPAFTKRNRSNSDAFAPRSDQGRKFRRSLPPINKARRLQAALEFRGKTAALEHLQHRRNLEGLFDGLGNRRADCLRLPPPPSFSSEH